MIASVILSLAAAVSNPEPQVALGKIETPLQCRIMVAGVSRSGDISICRTKAAWRELESCQGATRYCSPEQKAAIAAKHTAFSLTEDSRIVCRMLSATGSRLRSQEACLPMREWQRMWDNTSETMRELQNRHSNRPAEGQ